MQRTASDLVENIHSLISMPEVYLRVQQLTESPTSSINDFAKVIQFDPALSARILSISNSSFFGFPAKIETLDRAVNLLGISQIHDLVLASSAIQFFSTVEINVLNKMDFWRDSIHCAVLCRMLAQQANILENERLFVAGLLHQLGYLVICLEEPQTVLRIIEKSEKDQKPRYLIEREILGFDYAQVSGALLRKWKLPAAFHEIVEFHIEPSKGTQFPLETLILHIAQRLVEKTNQERKGIIAPLDIPPETLELLNLDEHQLGKLKNESNQHLIESMKLLLTRSSPVAA
ncbi:MAG: HDOD domain-containing protein [Cycloclasticus sp.]